MKSALVAVVAAATSQAVLGFAPVSPAGTRSGVLALRAQVPENSRYENHFSRGKFRASLVRCVVK